MLIKGQQKRNNRLFLIIIFRTVTPVQHKHEQFCKPINSWACQLMCPAYNTNVNMRGNTIKWERNVSRKDNLPCSCDYKIWFYINSPRNRGLKLLRQFPICMNLLIFIEKNHNFEFHFSRSALKITSSWSPCCLMNFYF